MPRSPADIDALAALGEPRRREIVELLVSGERAVGSIVESMGIAQPSVSKHLAVLRSAGIVSMARRGRERVYRLEPLALRAVHDWTRTFEHLWSHQADRIKQRAEAGATNAAGPRAGASGGGDAASWTSGSYLPGSTPVARRPGSNTRKN